MPKYSMSVNWLYSFIEIVQGIWFLKVVSLIITNIMERFADIRSLLRRRGERISDFDSLIGATALHHDLTLLSYDTRHFKRIPDLKLYPPAAYTLACRTSSIVRNKW
jgi:predicted nucleic acid-binding protein